MKNFKRNIYRLNIEESVIIECKEFELSGGTSGRTFNFTNCDGQSQQIIIPQNDSASFCIQLPFLAAGAVQIGNCGTPPP
jgi:hypothetical protein